MKAMWIAMVLTVVAWASWLWRYDVQVIPVNVADFNDQQNDGMFIGEDNVLYVINAEDGSCRPAINAATQKPVEPLVPKSPAIVWRWDRWTATGSVQQFAQVDAAGRVTLMPMPVGDGK